MFKFITRSEMFNSSVFADNLIAEFQQSYTLDIDLSVKAEAKMLKKYYDHLHPFQVIEPPISSHCVLAYNAGSKKDYIKTFPLILKSYFCVEYSSMEEKFNSLAKYKFGMAMCLNRAFYVPII